MSAAKGRGMLREMSDRLRLIWARKQALRADWRTQEWLAIDLETNGLDASVDGILSMAWVAISSDGIDLSSAAYHVVHCSQPLNQSVVHHGLTQADLANGESLSTVLSQLAPVLEGRILVAHHASFDWKLLRSAATATGVSLCPLGVLDTLALERSRPQARYRQLQSQDTDTDSYTLSACRRRHHLPDKPEHHALEDAVAVGELFLAQAWQIGGSRALSSRELLRRANG